MLLASLLPGDAVTSPLLHCPFTLAYSGGCMLLAAAAAGPLLGLRQQMLRYNNAAASTSAADYDSEIHIDELLLLLQAGRCEAAAAGCMQQLHRCTML